MKRIGWGVIAAVAVLAIAAALYLALPLPEKTREILLLAIGAFAGVVTAYLLIRIAAYGAGLWTAGPWIPIVASASTIAALYMLPAGESRSRVLAVVIGFTISLLIWALIAVLASQRSSPCRANGRAYAAVQERTREVEVRVSALEKEGRELPMDGVRQAREQLKAVQERLHRGETEFDAAWYTGSAYQDLWAALHRAEEWLIGGGSVGELRASLVHDRIRVAGSPLGRQMRKELEEVEKELPKDGAGAPGAALVMRLRLIRRAINEFRDGRWDGLVRATDRLARSILITAWTAFALLILSIALEADRDAIAAGAVFFLVGALVGLMAQLRADAQRDEAVEDYGLSKARLYQTVLASGIAGVAGVVLMAIAVDASAGADAARVGLSDIFDVSGSPGQLLIAAVFGLSPQLLIDRLSATADQYRAELSATAAGGSASAEALGGLES